ncbi:hypothetical protein CCR75_003737 [Bremia lactucae]|uniref:Uncharacterized protein n=1 Tax=Bremia lactucae TaxID=4779 RepID=A0A976IEK0_BRELC|nr:hypothetical protein CCR75_003737 [Bremia lactucae]
MFTTIPVPEPSLPKFSTREIRFRKARDANILIFSIPTRSSVLLPLLNPKSYAFKKQDTRCLHLLQAVALIPSCKYEKLLATVDEALKMPLSAATRRKLELKLRPLTKKLHDENDESGNRPLISLQLKETVAKCLRDWIADPVEGYVLRKEYVVSGMRLDDLVATPAGAGVLRAYRGSDRFCTVVYPWGYGYVHIKDVKKVLNTAKKQQTKKRSYNERVALEHKQLSEQIEGLLGDSSPPAHDDCDVVKKEETKQEIEDTEEFDDLFDSLKEENEHKSTLRKDLIFLRCVDVLARKVKDFRRDQMTMEPDLKLPRTCDKDETPGDVDQQERENSLQTEDIEMERTKVQEE